VLWCGAAPDQARVASEQLLSGGLVSYLQDGRGGQSYARQVRPAEQHPAHLLEDDTQLGKSGAGTTKGLGHAQAR
jgi:hypothetical protein